MQANMPDRPIPDFNKQFEGDWLVDHSVYPVATRNDIIDTMFKLVDILDNPVHIETYHHLQRGHNPYSIVGKK